MNAYNEHLKNFQQIQGNIQQNAKDFKSLFTQQPGADTGKQISDATNGIINS